VAMDSDVKGFLFGGGVSAKFPKVGYVMTGTVESFKMMNQTDYDTGEPLFWKNGDPRKQLVITLQTDEQGSFDEEGEPKEVPNDDGVRSLYVKGNLQKRLGKALKDANSDLEVGGQITVKRIKNAPKTNPKFKAPYDFDVVYVPASKNSAAATAFAQDDSPFEE
jgi:hypothetical protein